MGNTQGWKIISILASLQRLATIGPSSAYVQTSVGGYTFTIPDFIDNERRTQSNAQTWCTGNQSKLLEITTDSLQQSIVQFINNARNQNQMPGNTVITNGKRFSHSQFSWVNGNAIGSNLPVKGQDPGFSRSYGFLNSSQNVFEFIADMPTVTRGYVCDGSTLCADGFKSNGRCYKSYSDTLSWFGARNKCIDGGGDLASFNFIVDEKGFSTLNGSGWNQPSTYWVGLQRLDWKWQGTNSDVRYSQWATYSPDYSKNPSNECLCLQPNNPTYDWKWIECDCNQAYNFICMTEMNSTSTLSSITSVSTVSEIASTRGTRNTATTQPVNSAPSLSMPEYSSTTAVSSPSPAVAIVSAETRKTDYKLPVGLGVGLGGAALIAVIVVIIVVVVRRKGCRRKARLPKSTSDPPDVTPESYYATVVKNLEYDDRPLDTVSDVVIPPPTEYADLKIVSATKSTEDNDYVRRRSLA